MVTREQRAAFNRRRWLKNGAQVALALCVFLAVRAWQQHGAARGAVPNISGSTVGGERISLSSYRGEPVLVHFFATWCGVCTAMESNIANVADDHRVLFVGTRSGSASELHAYLEEQRLTHVDVLVDESGAMADQFGIKGIPATFYVNAEGNIESVEVGYTTELGIRARTWTL